MSVPPAPDDAGKHDCGDSELDALDGQSTFAEPPDNVKFTHSAAATQVPMLLIITRGTHIRINHRINC